MKQDKETTDVLFLMSLEDKHAPQDVFAFFPKEEYYSEGNIGYGGVTKDNWQDTKQSYAHIGQHSACHIDYANECENATEDQYQDLKKELESIGYKLNVLNKS